MVTNILVTFFNGTAAVPIKLENNLLDGVLKHMNMTREQALQNNIRINLVREFNTVNVPYEPVHDVVSVSDWSAGTSLELNPMFYIADKGTFAADQFDQYYREWRNR